MVQEYLFFDFWNRLIMASSGFQFEDTPKALANFSPRFEAKQEPWVKNCN